MRKSISAQESMDAMDLESDPDLQPSLLLVEQTEADSNNNSNNIASTSMKREVTVRFRGTKAALGPHRQCQAVVTEDFMHHFTTLNEILVKGNPFVEFPDVPSSSSNNAITLEVDGEYRKPPVTSSSLLSAYGKELLGNKKFPEKLLTTLDSATMPVHCVLDMWLWLEVQKYFSLVTASTHDANVLQLLDVGASKLSQSWYKPLEDEDTAVTDCDEVSATEAVVDVKEHIQFAHNSLQFIREVYEDPSLDEIISNQSKYLPEESHTVEEVIQRLEEALLRNNLHTNQHIANLRKRQIDTASFWQEHEKSIRDNMLDGMTGKRYMKLNKKQKIFKRFAGDKPAGEGTAALV